MERRPPQEHRRRHRRLAAPAGGRGRGLIGHGVVLSAQPEPGPHYSEPGKTAMYVPVAFDALLPLGDQIPVGVPRGRRARDPWDGGPSRGWPSTRPRRRISAPCGVISGASRARIPPKPCPGAIRKAPSPGSRSTATNGARTPGGPASPTTAPAAPPADSPSSSSTARSAGTSSTSITSSRCPSSAAAMNSIPSLTSCRSAPTAMPWPTRE